MKKIISILAVLSLMMASSVISWHCCLWFRPILPVADRQRIFYKLGYLEYEDIDGICGPKTHFAQRLYEHDWEAVKEWKARQK